MSELNICDRLYSSSVTLSEMYVLLCLEKIYFEHSVLIRYVFCFLFFILKCISYYGNSRIFFIGNLVFHGRLLTNPPHIKERTDFFWRGGSGVPCKPIEETFIIIIIMLYRHHGYPWPSLATSPYHSSPLAGFQGYIPYPHIAAVCMFELVVLLLLGHMRGSIGVHQLVLASPAVSCVSGSSSLDNFRDGRQVAVSLVPCGVLPPGLTITNFREK